MRLKERGVYSHNCNKLNKSYMLLAKISREFKNSQISRPEIKSQHRCQNPRSGLLCYAFVSLSILWTWHWTRWNTQSLVYYKSKNLNGLNDFDPFFLIVVFCSNSHRGRLNQFYQRRGRAFIIWGVYLRQTSHHLCAYFKINRFDELSSTKIRRFPGPNILPRCAIHALCEWRQFFVTFVTRGMSHDII